MNENPSNDNSYNDYYINFKPNNFNNLTTKILICYSRWAPIRQDAGAHALRDKRSWNKPGFFISPGFGDFRLMRQAILAERILTKVKTDDTACRRNLQQIQSGKKSFVYGQMK